jgi:hypothetical protein
MVLTISNVEVMGLKPYSLNDILQILKELEYMGPLIPNLKSYYLIYRLQTCLNGGFAPPMLISLIKLNDFEQFWQIQGLEFQEYLAYNIIYGYIIFNDS